jgi:hypothetical protein
MHNILGKKTRRSIFLFSIIIIGIYLIIYQPLKDAAAVGGVISVYTGYSHNLDYNYFHIEEFICENPDYFSIVSPESITPCVEAFEGAYYINKSGIQSILEYENVVGVHPAILFSLGGNASEKHISTFNNYRVSVGLKPVDSDTFGFMVAAVEPSIFMVFESDLVDGRFLMEDDEFKIVINRFMKDRCGYEVGDKIQFIHDFYWKDRVYEIVGVFEDPFTELPGYSAMVLMSCEELFDMLEVGEEEELYNFLYVCIRNPVQDRNKNELVQYLDALFPEALISARKIPSNK